jgi:hypothetical protein
MKKVDDFLAQPGEAWKSAYLAAPSGERLLCTEVMASGGVINLTDLQRRYEVSISSAPSDYQSFDTSFTNALGTFLRRRSLAPGVDYVQFYHPSMRDLLIELIQRDKLIRVAYIKQLNVKEISSLAKRRNTKSNSIGSQEHQILINDEDDRELIIDHLRDTLLPTSTLQDLLGVLTDIRSMFPDSDHSLVPRNLRLSIEYEKLLWMILDCIVPHACSKLFWQKNSEQAFILLWRRFFESLRILLPLVTAPCTPEYIPELLRRHKDNSSVDYWGMVHAMHNIVPTIVEQCIDLSIREQCRLHLSNAVDDALQESNNLNLEGDYYDSQHWYETYESILDDCKDYAELFPDDNSIAKLDDLVDLFDSYPRLEEGSDDDYHSLPSGLSSLDSNETIMEIFSDL